MPGHRLYSCPGGGIRHPWLHRGLLKSPRKTSLAGCLGALPTTSLFPFGKALMGSMASSARCAAETRLSQRMVIGNDSETSQSVSGKKE